MKLRIKHMLKVEEGEGLCFYRNCMEKLVLFIMRQRFFQFPCRRLYEISAKLFLPKLSGFSYRKLRIYIPKGRKSFSESQESSAG